MGYICLTAWRDLEDGHLYREGEPFPFDGRDVEPDRLDALESGQNRAGLRLIQALEVQDEGSPVRKEEAPKKAPVASKTAAPRKRTTKK